MIYLAIEFWALCFTLLLIVHRSLVRRYNYQAITRREALIFFVMSPIVLITILYCWFSESEFWSKPL